MKNCVIIAAILSLLVGCDESHLRRNVTVIAEGRTQGTPQRTTTLLEDDKTHVRFWVYGFFGKKGDKFVYEKKLGE